MSFFNSQLFIIYLKFYQFIFLGVVQGILTGMRGLCSGLGPAVYGFIFYLFHVDLNQDSATNTDAPKVVSF